MCVGVKCSEEGTVMTHLRFSVPALVLLLVAPALAAAQTDLTGDWVLTITSPQGTREFSAKLKQDAEKVTGTIVTVRGETPLEGTVTGPDVKITWKTEFQGQPFPVTLTGKLEDGALKGKADFAGMAQGDWSAKRGTLTPPAATPTTTTSSTSSTSVAPADIAGNWDITFKTLAGEYTGKAVIKQDGDKVSGTVANQMGQQPLSGTMEGKTLKMSFVSKTANGDIPVSLTGDVDGDTIAGKAEIGGIPGEWTAKRAKQ
jgi:hypothetical protein